MTPNDITPGDSDPATNPAGDGVNVTDGSVAQARYGKRTLTILVVSVVLVVLVLFALFGLHAGMSPAVTGPNPAASSFNAADPSPKQAPPGVPSTTGQATTTSTANPGS